MASFLGWLPLGGIPKELWKRWQVRIVDRLDAALLRRVSRFNRRYREFVLSSLRFIDLKGLPTVGFYTPELDEVFVDVSLAYRAPHDVPESLLAQLPADITDRHSIADFLDNPQPMVLAVIGAPGGGKTTLLRHTARVVCRSRRGRRRTVPILLYLRDHAGAIAANPQIALPTLVRGTLGRYGPDEPPDWFEQRLANGYCVILLDGLDEIARQEDRLAVAGWVERATKQYPKNDFVITSRPQGYRTAPIDGAIVLQVRNFIDDQITRFVRGWYLAVEKHSTGATAEEIRIRAESAADELLDRLNSNPSLYDLTANPLLLTMIANVHRFRGALPGSRADLYGEICQVMLWRRLEAKKLPTQLAGDKKENLLRAIAFTMMLRRVRDLPRADILAELKPTLRRMSTKLSEEDFLADVSSNGLLIERESGQYSFAHLTFQEYLAATHIRDKGLVQTLAIAVDDTWWRETTLLYGAYSDADPIVEACLNSGSINALSLAFDCDDQGSELAPDIRKRLDQVLHDTPDSPEHRRLQTAVRVARNLREQVRTTAGNRVCARPVSTEVYRLFLADTATPAPDGPDFGPYKPATGIRGRDASKFVRWLNGLTGLQPAYRLPSRAEINDPAVQRALSRTPTLSVWLERTATHGRLELELWTPPDSGHPRRIDAEVVARHIHADVRRATRILSDLILLQPLVAILALDRSDREPALTSARARDHARDRALAHDLVRNYDPEFASDLTRSLTHALSVALIERTRPFSADLAGSIQLAFDGARARNRTHDIALELALDHALADVRDLASEPDITVAMPSFFGEKAIGRALWAALTHAHRTSSTVQSWPDEFAYAFVSETQVAGVSYVDLDALTGMVSEGSDRLQTWLNLDRHSWAFETASHLREMALPVLRRRERLTADTAAAMRIAALCLAGEADRSRPSAVGDLYRRIAAGITLLERRHSGKAPATEAILLATG